MKVSELIEKLIEMPQDAEVLHLWDGSPRTSIEVVYLSKNGDVITADYNMVCYYDDARPIGAPNDKEDKYWKTERGPKTDEFDL